MKAPYPKNVRVFALIAVGASMFAIAAYSFSWFPRVTHGFAMYYTYARMLLEGEDFSRVYDYAYFNAKIGEYGMTVLDMPNNIPTNALVMLPLAWLPPGVVKIVWGTISLLALTASLKILFSLFEIKLRETTGLLLLTYVLMFRPIYDCIALGQLYFLLLFLFSLSLRGILRRNEWMTSIPIAGAFLAKGYGTIPMLFLLYARRWKAFAITVSSICAVVMLTLPAFGMNTWATFYHRVLTTLGTLPSDGHTAYQTHNGIILHLFSFDERWLPHPIAVLPTGVLRTLSYAINLALIVHVFARSNTTAPGDLALSFSAAIAAGVITAPLAEEYHFVLCLPIVLGFVSMRLRSRHQKIGSTAFDYVFALSAIILALPIPYKALNDAAFPLILLAYPKLYATLGLLACFSFRTRWMSESVVVYR